ncbi:MAG: Asp-tRNA(Asn)/Glu-tRNA(Gln) amidotransferase subunit GatC [Candidatus Nanohaloarchaea archaeon]|nr:Asp-tRNA(Asn)/Glu-tRNA(Gln) amidotransferase subunit GatC [Candidatus Nanohaloarchaea archaeon]
MVDRETVEDVAGQAKVELSEEQKEEFKEDLDEILDAFRSIDDVDTEGVEPAFHPIEVGEKTRDDDVEDPLSQEEALSNSENTEEGYFKGPRAT